MTEHSKSGTNVQSFCPFPSVAGKKGIVIERSFFEHNTTTHLAENSPEYLTKEDMVSLLEPYATIPFAGERGIQTMAEQWQGTPIGQALQELPDGEAVSVMDFARAIGNKFRELKRSENWVDVSYREVKRKMNGEYVTDRQFHLDWQGRATAYRYAADQAVGGLPVRNFDRINVQFTPDMTRNNAFILHEHKGETVYYPPMYQQRLYLSLSQYRLIEQTGDGTFVERAALPFLYIDTDVKVGEDQEITPAPFVRVFLSDYQEEHLTSVLFDRSYPASLFDKEVCFPNPLPTIEHAPPDIDQRIIAPLPRDLAIPQDMPYSAHELTEEVYTTWCEIDSDEPEWIKDENGNFVVDNEE